MKLQNDYDYSSINAALPPIAGIMGGALKTYQTGSMDYGAAVFLGFFIGILVSVACLFIPLMLLHRGSSLRIFDFFYFMGMIAAPVLSFVIMYYFVID